MVVIVIAIAIARFDSYSKSCYLTLAVTVAMPVESQRQKTSFSNRELAA